MMLLVVFNLCAGLKVGRKILDTFVVRLISPLIISSLMAILFACHVGYKPDDGFNVEHSATPYLGQ